jgi:hypothetical protein
MISGKLSDRLRNYVITNKYGVKEGKEGGGLVM